MQPEAIVNMIVIAFVYICVGGLIGSVLLRAATNWVIGIQVDATTAFFCVVFSYLPRIVAGFVLMATRVSNDRQEQVSLLMIPFEFFVLVAVICWQLKFRIRTSLKISAMMFLFGFLLFLLVWAIFTILISAIRN